MTCPQCGAIVSEEQVFCEKCGKEMQLVPVFEAEIDETIEDTISQIAVDLASTQELKPIKPLTGSNQTEEELNIDKKSSLLPLWFMAGGIAFVIFLVVAVVSIFHLHDQKSYDYHVKKAEEMCLAQDFDQMLVHGKEAMKLAPNSSDARMLMARAYEGQGNLQYEQEMLEDLLAVDSAYAPAYSLLVPIYENAGEYEKIASLLMSCNEQSVLDKYADFLSNPPQASEEPGTYEDSVALKLLAPGNGDIYYTLDGTKPDKNDKKYTAPILLTAGKYTVTAVYINSYKVESDVLQAVYYIDEKVLEAPVVQLESGTYTEPQYITIAVPEDDYQVYYTSDGTEPGLESTMYEGPIPLPLGNSHFAFVMYDESGIPSEIIYRDYRFDFEVSVTGEQASNMLIQTLISTGALSDADGHIPDVNGKRQYYTNTIVFEMGQYFYLIDEVFVSADGMSQKTGNQYAVNVMTGESYLAVRNTLGMYDLRRIQ